MTAAKQAQRTPEWAVARLGAVHWGLWAPAQKRPCPPMAQCSHGGDVGLREIARKLNAHDDLLAALRAAESFIADDSKSISRRGAVHDAICAAIAKAEA